MARLAEQEAVIEQLKAVAHPMRLRILEALSDAERNVGQIEQATGIGQPALSQQLGVLRKAGLVETRKEAKLVYYRIAAAELKGLSGALGALVKDKTGEAPPVAAKVPQSVAGVANFARLSR